MARFSISFSTLHRIAREMGLKKSTRFMRKTQALASERAKESHLRNGTYPKKGVQPPNLRRALEEGRSGYKKGVTNEQRLGKRKNAERIAKAAATRRQTIAAERRRVLFGLEQRTRLRVVRQSRNKLCYRSNLRKVGYIEDPHDHNVYYYPSEEMRRPVREANGAKYHIRFYPLPKPQSDDQELRQGDGAAE